MATYAINRRREVGAWRQRDRRTVVDSRAVRGRRDETKISPRVRGLFHREKAPAKEPHVQAPMRGVPSTFSLFFRNCFFVEYRGGPARAGLGQRMIARADLDRAGTEKLNPRSDKAEERDLL